MALTFLGASTTSDARNTIGCLVLLPILIACLHYYRYRLGPGDFDGTDDNIGFAYYDERDEDDDDDLIQQEVVEITFDFGIMEGNVRRFFSRMHRVMI
jgi:hypothetical protein